jgi:hypothetical protein
MKLISVLSLLTAVSISANAKAMRTKSPPAMSREEITRVVRNAFGDKVQAVSDFGNGRFYLPGDFNGDGFSDIAVIVNIEQARADLKSHGVMYNDADPWSRRNGTQIDPLTDERQNCLGIAIIHGTALGWKAAEQAGKFMVYDCFSSVRLIRKGQRIGRGNVSVGATPKPKGDSIFLDLESGATAIVYWNGKTYRGFGIMGYD